MEPNNWEKEIKKKLNNRTIQPTDAAWDRLDAMLSVTEKKKVKPVRIWMYAAAGFVGILLTASLFFKVAQNPETVPVVNDNVDGIVITPSTTLGADSITIGNILDNNKASAVKPAVMVAQQPVANTQNPVKEKTESRVKTKHIKTQPGVMVNNTSDLAVSGTTLSVPLTPDMEAEKLLEETLLSVKLPKEKPTVKVNANSLLNEVEDQLDNNYRSKTWQTITEKYNAVKTSVVNRNIE
ncbi:hypothetical protein Q763_13190 [Flavobacterium beibuense F44-8]|uniref:Uncharacterized protein n=1 Tax=Flavobacterium beibuense F44-8 TaxID=1406840 RepID=A0A0A2LJR7_9FLAO|nr:hypothetical protein [Flavobacterium beibuense]KGO79501.1 hypothetical protein Q763_13190 [Flavobacterium beibuense F44-8]